MQERPAAIAAPVPVAPVRAPLPTSPGIAPHQALIDAPPERHEPRHEPREDIRALVRGLVDEAVAPLLRITVELEHRIQRLEERPPPAPVYVAQSATAAMTYDAQQQSHAAAISSPAQVVRPAPLLNIAAIERDVRIQVDGALDGGKRKFRLVLTFVLLLVVAFGGLFAALAQSYAPPR